MKFLRKKIIAILATIPVLISSTGTVFAEESYYYKDAEYSKIVKSTSLAPWQSKDIGGSSIVISAATIYNGNYVGKERIRAWTRNAFIANYFNAYQCVTRSKS